MTPIQQTTLQIAKKYVGQHESGGPNHGPFVAKLQMWFGRWALGQPWCAMFATWCIFQAGKQLGVQPHFLKSASSSEIYGWAKTNGHLLAQPENGCVGLLKGGPTGHQHTLLCHTVEGVQVITIEGNLSDRVKWFHRLSVDCDWVRIS